jgi:hypothetical protein
VRSLEDLARIRLSRLLFMRDFLFSEIAAVEGMQNIPDDRPGRALNPFGANGTNAVWVAGTRSPRQLSF